jgi:hypothetical protein
MNLQVGRSNYFIGRASNETGGRRIMIDESGAYELPRLASLMG